MTREDEPTTHRKLVVLPGGAERDQGPQTVLDALEAYAEDRSGSIVEEQRPLLELVLQMLARFFDPPAEDTRPPSWSCGANRTRATRLVAALGCCVRLFPYANLLSAALIPSFERETLRLARWCCRHALCGSRELSRFETAHRGASPLLRRFHRLQRALECQIMPPLAGGREGDDVDEHLIEGRFVIESSSRDGVAVSVPGEAPYAPVRIPAAFRELYRPGQAVSLLLVEARRGWRPIASSLPMEFGHAEQLYREAQRTLTSPDASAPRHLT
ncbi:MAG: hypothetical protein JSV80_16185 [Acidobacteriota bacterium]|nr:MAG: hypothetical protein JSV80_16185 [Acidobacteriota bacterium]